MLVSAMLQIRAERTIDIDQLCAVHLAVAPSLDPMFGTRHL